LYENDNAAFVKDWNDKTGDNVTINPSHGGITSPRGVAPSGTRETTTEKKFAIL
jgi:ABC-type sulfate transport system substrate-binding protein